MKLKANTAKYRFPGDHLESAMFWHKDPKKNPGEPAYCLTQINARDMIALHDEEKNQGVRGRPSHIAVVIGELWFWPVPAENLTACVRYSTIHEM